MLADRFDVVIGVDTHRDTLALALLAAGSGALLAGRELPASPAGYREALGFARAYGQRRLWALEGTGSYGVGLARFLARAGERLVEVERPRRSGARGRGKSDALDALAAARAVLSGEAGVEPRAQGARAALRVLLTTREGAVATRRAGLAQLRALVVSAPEELRERLRGLGRSRLVLSCLKLRAPARAEPELRASVLALRLVARRVQAATREARELEATLQAQVEALAPSLLALPGVGPVTASALLVAWSHPGRLSSEAAFARLAGAAPIPASSGRTVRHRLDRGGDRKLNRALHLIVLARRRCHSPTIAYIERRTREGKSEREAVRCLKRYLARSLFRQLERSGGLPELA